MDQKKQETTTVRTRDLGLASYLLASGFPLLRLEWDHAGNAEFVFRHGEEDTDLATLSMRYFSGTAQVPALGYKSALDELRRRLFRERGRSR